MILSSQGGPMNESHEMRNWRIDRWGLVRGLALLVSSLLAITALHYLVLAIFRG
jgi:hypothetical protein